MGSEVRPGNQSGDYDYRLQISLEDSLAQQIRIDTNSICVEDSVLEIVNETPSTDALGQQLISDNNVGQIKKAACRFVDKSVTFVIQNPIKTTVIIIFIGIGCSYLYNNRNEITSGFKRRKDQLSDFFHKFKR